MAFFIVLAFSMFVFGIVALIVGHVRWAHIHNRRAAGFVTGAGFVALIIFAMLSDQGSSTPVEVSAGSAAARSNQTAAADETTPPASSEPSQVGATSPAALAAPLKTTPSTATAPPAAPAAATTRPAPVAAHTSAPAAAAAPARTTAAAPPPAAAAPAPATAPANPPATTANAACHPLSSSGNCYQAGQYCRESDHGVHGVARNGEAIVCTDSNGWRWEPA